MKFRHIIAGMSCVVGCEMAHATTCGAEIGAPAHLEQQVALLKLPTDTNTILLLAAVESGFDSQARSNRGALGLLQVTMPAAYEVAAVTSRQRMIRTASLPSADFESRAIFWLRYCALPEPSEEVLLNPVWNIRYGACYLHLLLQQTSGNLTAALIAYNGGFRQLQRMEDGKQLARETSDYVTKFHYLREVHPSCRD